MAVLPKACRNPCATGAAAALREQNPGDGPEISECSTGTTGSECRFGIGASRAVPITGRGNIRVLPKWCENRCVSESVRNGSRCRPPGAESGRWTGNLRFRPRDDRVGVPIRNWGLAGGSDHRARKYARFAEVVRKSVY
ncbi:hypothetical protein Taro_015411 [Colocasia esculenta]|uniref:Uncharacterized protein n=1 Tax=Colocasia esculenta TaxID=4460 RepID=A0A843UT31_COLES|nr:hypothetical protein [Colocasia esculenta]